MGRRRSVALALAVVSAATVAVVAPSAGATTTGYADPGAPFELATAVAVGPDGSAWVMDIGTDRVNRIDPLTGAVTGFDVGSTALYDIAVDPDGIVWFAAASDGSAAWTRRPAR